MPFVKHAVNGPSGFVSLLMGVAIYIDEGVFGPVRRRLAGGGSPIGLTLEVAIEPLHHFVAAIGIRNGIDEDDELFADASDVWLVRDREAIGEFEDGFRRAGFIGVQASIEVVDRAGGGDERFSSGGRKGTRVSEGCGGGFEAVEVADAGFVGDGEHQDIAVLFATADGKNANTRRRGGQGTAVGVRFRSVDEFAWGTGDAAKKGKWRGNTVRSWKIRNPRRKETRIAGGFRDRFDGTRFGSVGAAESVESAAAAKVLSKAAIPTSHRIIARLRLGEFASL